jgi:hypothetical protein
MNELYMEQLIEAMRDMADLVDRIAPRRPVLEEKLLRLIRTTQYTWRWHPGTSRVTADLTASYRVTLTPSEDVTVVTLARKQPNDAGGLTDATFPEMYLSLDVWYWAYNKATKDDLVTLDDILSGYSEPEDVISPEALGKLVDAGLVQASSIPLAARAIDEEMDTERVEAKKQRECHANTIAEICAVLVRNAYEAGDGGDEG